MCCHQTIDWIMKEEKDFFAPYIAGHLGKSLEEAQTIRKKLDNFGPTIKVRTLGELAYYMFCTPYSLVYMQYIYRKHSHKLRAT